MREHQIIITLKPDQFLQVQRLARLAGAKSMGMFVRQKLLAALGIEGELENEGRNVDLQPTISELKRLHSELRGFVAESLAMYMSDYHIGESVVGDPDLAFSAYNPDRQDQQVDASATEPANEAPPSLNSYQAGGDPFQPSYESEQPQTSDAVFYVEPAQQDDMYNEVAEEPQQRQVAFFEEPFDGMNYSEGDLVQDQSQYGPLNADDTESSPVVAYEEGPLDYQGSDERLIEGDDGEYDQTDLLESQHDERSNDAPPARMAVEDHADSGPPAESRRDIQANDELEKLADRTFAISPRLGAIEPPTQLPGNRSLPAPNPVLRDPLGELLEGADFLEEEETAAAEEDETFSVPFSIQERRRQLAESDLNQTTIPLGKLQQDKVQPADEPLDDIATEVIRHSRQQISDSSSTRSGPVPPSSSDAVPVKSNPDSVTREATDPPKPARDAGSLGNQGGGPISGGPPPKRRKS